jgi:hypothetical protein
MTRQRIIVIATVVAVTACSDHFDADLTKCKAQVVGVYGPAPMSKAEWAGYVRECMRAQGWPIKDACLDKREMWDAPECYLR